MSHQKFNLILRSRELITPRVMKFTFVREDGEALRYVPGQFITLHLPWDEMILRRSYSIATIPADDAGAQAIEIAVTEVADGRATGVLFDLRPGARVEATGPFGRFVLREDEPARYLLVATGTGVSPYRAMLPELRRRVQEEGFEARLMLGVRGPDELLFGSDFERAAEEAAQFDFTPSYSRRDGEQVHRGYVQDQLKGLELDPERDIVYLCGNPDMIDTAVAHLKEIGFTNRRIRREKYVSSN